DDQLAGGVGRDFLNGGDGDDTLTAIDGSTGDTLYGDLGTDSFWVDEVPFQMFGIRLDVTDALVDATPRETGNVHRVRGFANGADLTPDGDAIPDPTDGTNYKAFAGRPLFARSGPSEADVYQGGVG